MFFGDGTQRITVLPVGPTPDELRGALQWELTQKELFTETLQAVCTARVPMVGARGISCHTDVTGDLVASSKNGKRVLIQAVHCPSGVDHIFVRKLVAERAEVQRVAILTPDESGHASLEARLANSELPKVQAFGASELEQLAVGVYNELGFGGNTTLPKPLSVRSRS